MNVLVAFRTNGNENLGGGHLTRCLALAKELKKRNFKVLFLTKYAADLVKEMGFKVTRIGTRVMGSIDDAQETVYIVSRENVDILITDLNDIGVVFTKHVKSHSKCHLISLDNVGNKHLYSDAVINSSIAPELQAYKFNPETTYYIGPKYAILKPEFLHFHSLYKTIPEKCKSILVCFGSSDPTNLTGYVLDSLRSLEADVKFTVIVGKFYRHLEELKESCCQLNADIIVDAPNIAELLYKSDLAIITAGLLAYEATTLGVPSIAINRDNINYLTARAFAKRNAMVNLGLASKISSELIRRAVSSLTKDRNRRALLSKNGKVLIDARGIFRVIDIISSCT